MKKVKIVLLISIFLLFAILAYGGVKGNIGKLHKPTSGQIIDTSKRIDVNNIDMPVSNTGDWAWNLITGNAGFIFPKGTTKTAVYAGGLWIGGRVSPAEDIRMAVSEYSDEYVPGIMMDSTFAPDVARFHVYKVNLGDTRESNPDFAEWADSARMDGAPVDSLGNPLIMGDQTLWCVYNDADPAAHSNDAGSTAPLGIEVQQTTFAFNRKGALGNTIYIKYKLINKGPNYIDTCYVAVWSDPDLGGASDDFVGCDTLLSLGFVYNATNNDQLYDGTPPAVGYDFFQGPLVQGLPSDTGMLNGIPRPGYKNLGMTAFNKYINGTDPRTFTQAYWYLKGLDAVVGSGDPYRNPKTNEITTFALSGDPVAGTGWLDTDPADRRLMLCSGPFTFAPGDTQEVVVGIIVGQGSNRLSSVSAMKFYDVQAQQTFDANFVVPPTPPTPVVYYRPFKEGVDLIWDRRAEDFTWVSPSGIPRVLVFEGYNVYQGASTNGPWTKIATYDLSDTSNAHRVGALYVDQFDANAGAVVKTIDQAGSNSGLVHHLFIDKDNIAGGKLVDGKQYYFAVTAYAFDTLHLEPYIVNDVTLGYSTFTEENNLDASIAIAAKPLSQTGVEVDTAVHSAGKSTAIVDIEYINQAKIKDHNYRVTFNADVDSSWNLFDVTTGDTLLKNQTNKSKDYEFPLLTDHGIQVRVWSPLTPGILDWSFTPASKMWFTGVNWGGAFLGGGLDIGYNFFGSSITLQSTNFVDVEVRFSRTHTQKAYDYLRHGTPSYGFIGYFECPFTVWDVTSNPPRQLNAAFVDNNGSTSYDSTWGPTESSSDREYLFILNSTYSETPLPQYTTHNINAEPDSFDVLYALWPVLVSGHTLKELADGQVFKILAAIPASPQDTFTFKTYKVGEKNGNFVKKTLDNIWVVPNPFYTRAYNQGPFEHAVQFMNLPPERWTIRIFNLAGDLIRTLHQADPTSSVFFWDLLTEKGLPVASGIYIYYIEAEGLGSTFGKMAIFMEEERLPTF